MTMRTLLTGSVVAAGLLASCTSSDGAAGVIVAGTTSGGVTSTDGDTPVGTAGGTSPEGLEPGWLILAWEAGDNDLEASLVEDIVEMGEIDTADVDIVTLLDRSDEADPDGGYSDAASYPGIEEELGASQVLAGGDGGMELVASVPEVNTGDPDALAAFLTQALEQYPREHVAVVISDHGSGWTGVAYDDTDDDHLELAEISAAFEESLAAVGRDRFDIIGFDACLMATLEVGAAMAPHGDYLVASQEIEPGYGWDWTALDAVTAEMDGLDVGHLFVDSYAAFYADERVIANQTMSLVDLHRIDELSGAVAELVDAGSADPTAAAVALARAAVRAYAFADAPDPAESFHLLDIGDLAETLAVQNPGLTDATDAVRAALDDAVLSSITGTLSDQATGLSIYLPPNAALADDRYLALAGMPEWQEQLSKYLGTVTSVTAPAAFDDVDKLIEGRWTSGGFEIESGYDQAAEATIVDARLRYGTYDEEYTSMLFFGSDQLAFGDGHVSGVWDPQVMRITDGSTSALAYSTFEVAGDRSRAVASIPLEYVAPDGDVDRVDLRFVFDQAGKMLSKDFVLYTNSGVGRADVDPDGLLFPLAAVQSLADFEESWQRTTEVGLVADIDRFDGGYVPIDETTPIVAQLELHAIDGTVDFVYAGDAVPFEFYADRSSYPSPSAAR